MELLEHESERRMSREEAAKVLRALADELARNNNVSFVREGLRYTVDVPSEVTLEVEIEIEDDSSSIEVEISW